MGRNYEQLLEEYLSKAKEAEEQAYRCRDAVLKESWQRMALSYRQMAQRCLDTRNSVATSEQTSPMPASRASPTGDD